jgi:hypothetical protein
VTIVNDTTLGVQELHDEYAEQVNLAVAEGRDDIITALSARFASEPTVAPTTRQWERPGPPGPVGMA